MQVARVDVGPLGGCRTPGWVQVYAGGYRSLGWVQDPTMSAGPLAGRRSPGWMQVPRVDPALP